MTVRLKERILWWRCFLPVVFAHKPLCAPFHGHHLKIGRAHVCRSCLLLYLGGVSAAVLFWLRSDTLMQARIPFAAAVITILLLSYPAAYRHYPRICRDVLRFGLGVSAAGIMGLMITGHWRTGLVLTGCVVSARLIFNALRVRKRDEICAQCPEFHRRGICSGFRAKSRRMKLYERTLMRFLPARRISG